MKDKHSLSDVCACAIFLIGCLTLTLSASAQDVADDLLLPTSFHRSSGTINIGGINRCYDSYLSPNNYSGLAISGMVETWQQVKWGGGRWFEQDMYDTYVGLTTFGQGAALAAFENFTYALPWRVAAFDEYRFYVGPEVQARLGVVYNLRNSNNPANVKAALHAGAMGRAEANLDVSGVPVCMAYQLDLPLIGGFFAPEYTQSLYEIFTLDNESPVIHFASPANCFSTRQLVTIDVTHRHSITRFSLGYDVYQWHTSTAAFAIHTFQVGIGYVHNFYTIRPHETASQYIPY